MTSFVIHAEQTKAIFFDLNGTLIRDGNLHHRAFESIFAEYGIILSPEEYEAKVANHLNREIWPAVLQAEYDENDVASLSAVKEKIYRTLVSQEAIATPGVVELIKVMTEHDISAHLVTSAPRDLAHDILALLGLSTAFTTIISGNDVTKGKPNPEAYLLALEKAQVSADQALVFEDSPQGVMAAKGAGLTVIGVLPEYSAEQLFQAGAQSCVPDFRNVSIENQRN